MRTRMLVVASVMVLSSSLGASDTGTQGTDWTQFAGNPGHSRAQLRDELISALGTFAVRVATARLIGRVPLCGVVGSGSVAVADGFIVIPRDPARLVAYTVPTEV